MKKLESQFFVYQISSYWVQGPSGNVWVFSLQVETDAKEKSKISHHSTCDILIPNFSITTQLFGTRWLKFSLSIWWVENREIFYEPSLLRFPLSFLLNIGTVSLLFCQLTRFFKYTWNLEPFFKILIFFLCFFCKHCELSKYSQLTTQSILDKMLLSRDKIRN